MLSVHTSPLEQPGTGDAGGLNVYVVETARQLAERGTEVEIFTRARSSDDPPVVQLAPGVLVRHVVAGPFEGLSKNDLPGQLCAFAAGVMLVEARHDAGWYDVVHSHYWLSGQAGWLAADRWDIPLVHTMHTMAKVKNASLARGESAEPLGRVIGEEQVVAAADRLLANTDEERRQLIRLYGADQRRIAVVPPGVDLGTFTPGGPDGQRRARRRLGIDPQAQLLLFVGRIQPLKAPDVLLRAVAELRRSEPVGAEPVGAAPEGAGRVGAASRRVAPEGAVADRVQVAVLGGPSGSGLEHPQELHELARALGIADLVRFHHPVSRPVLADWYRAADLVAVPSYSESFGLVAVEAQACGTPVLAARVGGLRTAVADGLSGVLVDGHDPVEWARAAGDLLRDGPRRQRMRAAAMMQASGFSWDATAESTIDVYSEAMRRRRRVDVMPPEPLRAAESFAAVAP